MSATVLTSFVDAGSKFDLTAIGGGSSANFDVTFQTPFPSTPIVVVTSYRTEESPLWASQMNIGVVSRTSTGFTVRVTNTTDSSHTLGGFYWIAVLPSHA